MTTPLRLSLLALPIVTLTACGGSGPADQIIAPEPPDDVEEPEPTSSDFDDLSAAFDTLENSLPSEGTLPENVPLSGTATYTGYFSGELDPNVNTTDADVANGDVDFIAGDAQIIVDFANDTAIQGAAGNFRSDTVGSIEGTVVFFDFETTRGASAVVFEGNYGGNLTITDPDYPTGEQTVAGRFGGGYFGDNAENVSLVTVPIDGFNDIYFDGDIVAETDDLP